MFKPYDNHQFNSLPDFETASGRPATVLEKAQLCGRVVCRYGCHELVAIGLLHKHFDLEPSERLVRTVGRDRRAFAVPRVVASSEDVLPWIWRFGDGASGPGWYPLEFVQATTAGRGLYAVLQRCAPIFDELASVLIRHDLIDVFGVTASYADEGLRTDDHEHLVETSTTVPRRLDLRVSPRPPLDDDDDAIVTQYRWRGTQALELAAA